MTTAQRHLRANGMLLLAAVLWGMAFPAQRVANQTMGPMTYSSVRFAMGGLLLVAIILVLDRRRRTPSAQRRAATRAALVPGLIVGLLLTLAVNLQQVGLVSTTASNAAFITGLYLVCVPLLGVFFGRRPRASIGLAVVIAVAGLYLLVVTETFTLRSGDGLMLACAVAFALEILLIDRYADKLDALRFAATQFLVCALFSGLFALGLDKAPFAGLPQTLWPLAYGGFVSVGVAFTLQVLAQRDAEPAPAALIMALESVFGALGGIWLLHEHLSGRAWAGAGLMLVGILISQLPQRRRIEDG